MNILLKFFKPIDDLGIRCQILSQDQRRDMVDRQEVSFWHGIIIELDVPDWHGRSKIFHIKYYNDWIANGEINNTTIRINDEHYEFANPKFDPISIPKYIAKLILELTPEKPLPLKHIVEVINIDKFLKSFH